MVKLYITNYLSLLRNLQLNQPVETAVCTATKEASAVYGKQHTLKIIMFAINGVWDFSIDNETYYYYFIISNIFWWSRNN